MHATLQRLRRRLRANRFASFRRVTASLPRPLRVLDLGGTEAFWLTLVGPASAEFQVTLLNSHIDRTDLPRHAVPWIRSRSADARAVELWDLPAHDLVFSNSLLEHLGDRASQELVARHIESSGRPYFVQVPNKHCPIDPHFPSPWVPYFACYPRWWQARLLTWGAFGSGARSRTFEEALRRLRHYVPLGVSDMRALFPGGTLRVERTFGIGRSITVSRA